MFYSELLTLVFSWVFLLLSFVLCFFLFARALRHELVDWNIIFDLGFFSTGGGFLFGRFLDFFSNPSFYSWSLTKLIFFNVWPGINFWGVVLGIFLFAWLYLRNKKEDFWFIIDFAAAPLALMRGLLGIFLFFSKQAKVIDIGTVEIRLGLIYFLYYLSLFWAIKRLEKRKKHRGFFICFFLVFASVFESLMTFISSGQKLFSFISYALILSLGFLIFASLWWYVLAKRKPSSDFKNVFAFLLLGFFNLRRVLFSLEEAGKVSRAILFSPLYLIRSFYFGIKALLFEVAYSFVDLFHNIKPKR